MQLFIKQYLCKHKNKENNSIDEDKTMDEKIIMMIKSISEYLFEMLSNFSETIEDKVSEYENKLGSHIRLLNSKPNEMEAKLSMIKNKAKYFCNF